MATGAIVMSVVFFSHEDTKIRRQKNPISSCLRVFVAKALFVSLFLMSMEASAAMPPSVQEAQDYLRGLTTAQARFLQTTPDGSQFLGTFYLDRPGKLRFEYDDPVDDFVVADGLFIYFYDAQLGEQTNAPVGQTLANFLLRPDLRMEGDISVTDVRRGGGLLQVTLTQTEDPEAGSLTLGFEEAPLKLKKWRVIDATGAITEVELFKLETGVKLDSDLFVYADPKKSQPHRYNE